MPSDNTGIYQKVAEVREREYSWTALKPPDVVQTMTDAGGRKLYLWHVLDMHPVTGWFDGVVTEETPVLEDRIIKIIGWEVRNDGRWVHIAAMWDGDSEKFGDGWIVPEESVISKTELRTV